MVDDPTTLAENVDTTQSSPSTPSSGNTHIRLLRLDPSTFSGNSTESWSFWEYFEATVHENDKLADIEKFLSPNIPERRGSIDH